MLELSNKILQNWQIRKTRKQKSEFIEFLKHEIDEEIIIEEGGLFKSRNIIIGDISQAKIILSAHYDTQPVLPFPNFLSPKNIFVYLIYVMFQCLFIFGFMLIITLLFMFLTQGSDFSFIIGYLSLFVVMGIMLFGPANKHTANDNTSGVITLIEAMNIPEIKENVAFVFFDNEELGLLGSSLFAKMHKNEMKDKLLINFDCVSDGNSILYILSKPAQKEYLEKVKSSFISDDHKEAIITSSSNTLYPSDQMNFKKHIGVAAFKKHKWIGYYIDRIHTSKDTIFDETNIEFILEGLKKFCSA